MDSIKALIARLRERRPSVDHVVRMQEQFATTGASQQAGAVTYFAFLSFFPVLALAFFVVGVVSNVYPDANADLRTAINDILPGLIGPDAGQLSLDDVRSFSGLAGVVGLLGVVYSGTGWISALRSALLTVFDTPDGERPDFVKGKLRDLLTLVVIGLILLVSVALASFVSGFSGDVARFVGLGDALSPVISVLALLVGLAANAVLFFAMFRLLADPDVPARSLRSGAILGAVLFEVLKQISSVLLASTRGQPAAQAFGIALILLVWINYFSRVVLYSAAWAYTTPEARAERAAAPGEPVQGPATPSLAHVEFAHDRVEGRVEPHSWLTPFAAGGAAALAVVAVLRRRD